MQIVRENATLLTREGYASIRTYDVLGSEKGKLIKRVEITGFKEAREYRHNAKRSNENMGQ